MTHAAHPSPPPSEGLRIDWTRCTGRGVCAELLPELLDRDDWGYPLPREDGVAPRGSSAAPGRGGGIPVPRARRRDAREAVRLCPRLALRLEHS
ncbi:hypothetical protein GCM10009836_30830 [Pseudonocardia ailaonensis]|uniref:Ferredoxin n=1 Tax=Pseudonocardia ailaonensis TaxID=367279 RepID=A0ABN2N3P6_9PSEU